MLETILRKDLTDPRRATPLGYPVAVSAVYTVFILMTLYGLPGLLT
jgi:hypothetical protein